jgi:RNA 3'-terminal phosphate cyclase (ATP)
MMRIDGDIGEGGGQILRTALGLSLVTGRPFQIEKIRARRRKPGLLRQHLTAVEAAVKISNAKVHGNALGSQSLTFEPEKVVPGEYHFSVGTAGSATLVFQTILPALLMAGKPFRIFIEGGTHNPFAPPFDFLKTVFAPLVNKMGAGLELILHRPGFYPAGGGKLEANITPAVNLKPLFLMERGKIIHFKAKAMVARLNRDIALREIAVIKQGLSCGQEDLEVIEVKDSPGPGNIVTIEVKSEHITEMFIGFGELGKAAEVVAREAVEAAQRYVRAEVPVGQYLADQLLIPFVLAKGGVFKTTEPSGHTLTNIEVIKKFLKVEIDVKDLGNHQYMIAIQ